MEFYGRNDITLGGFLEMYCFRYNNIMYIYIIIILFALMEPPLSPWI